MTVLSVAEYGAFVRVADGIEAIIPSGEIPPGTGLEVGTKVKAEVSNIDTMDRRMTMSMRNVGESVAAEQFQVLNREKAASRSTTLGDLLMEKFGSKLQEMTSNAPEAGSEADASEQAAAAPESTEAEAPTAEDGAAAEAGADGSEPEQS